MKPLGARLGMGLPVLQEDYYTSINSYAYMNAAFPPKAWWDRHCMLPAYPRPRDTVRFWRDRLHPEYRRLQHRRRTENVGRRTVAGAQKF
jgi:hypothetical protein